MKIAYASYELEARHPLNSISSHSKREGALLKVIFQPDLIGYADCHSWPELGDLSLKEQLAFLLAGKLTPITRCALEIAFLDAQSRLQGKSIFTHLLNLPRSHFLVTNLLDLSSDDIRQIIQQGYTHVKLKMGRYLDQEMKCLLSLFSPTSLQLRLDFNESLNPLLFSSFLHSIESIRNQIDFIEDPFPFDFEEWKAIQREGWILACDRQVSIVSHKPEAAQILIIKPAVQSFQEWQQWKDRTCIVTSYLGHPLGQVAAAYVASLVDPSCSVVHGLLSHHVYQETSFSRHLSWKNPQFLLPQGTGFGFDKELNQLEWIFI